MSGRGALQSVAGKFLAGRRIGSEQKRVAAYKLPEYVLQIDALPRNPVGKILKRELREQARTLAPEVV